MRDQDGLWSHWSDPYQFIAGAPTGPQVDALRISEIMYNPADPTTQEAAAGFIDYMLSEEAQTFFAEETHEYPLVAGVAIDPRLIPLAEIDTPEMDLSDLSDLAGTLALLSDTGALD